VDIFLEYGFEATSMEAVARAAGITKRTLYARYQNKDVLFADVVVWALERYHWSEPPLEQGQTDLATSLTAIGRSALARALDPDIVRLNRMAICEAARVPEFASQTHSLTWSPRMQAVMGLLTAHKNAGSVIVDDIEIAAEQFLAMVAAIPARLATFGKTRTPDVEERHLQHAVSLFLRGALRR
jgi:AcrR family transcriptional regulator